MTGERQEDEWRALLARGQIRFQKCGGCGAFRHPARWICPDCLAETWAWAEVGGGATVEYLVRYETAFDPRGPAVPYDTAIVRLDEGPRLTTNLLGGGAPGRAIGGRCRLEIGRAPDGSMTLYARAEGAG